MLSTIVQVFSIWAGVATCAAFGLGATFSTLSSVPVAAREPQRSHHARVTTHEDYGCQSSCGVGR